MVLNPWNIGPHNVGAVLVQDNKLYFHTEKGCILFGKYSNLNCMLYVNSNRSKSHRMFHILCMVVSDGDGSNYLLYLQAQVATCMQYYKALAITQVTDVSKIRHFN